MIHKAPALVVTTRDRREKALLDIGIEGNRSILRTRLLTFTSWIGYLE